MSDINMCIPFFREETSILELLPTTTGFTCRLEVLKEWSVVIILVLYASRLPWEDE